MELLNKITVKGCGWDKKAILAALLKEAAQPAKDGKPAVEAVYHDAVDLVKVVGVVHQTRPGQTIVGDKTNDFLWLSGQFTAVNLSTGEMYGASKCIMSDLISGPIDAALREGASEVQFAVMISAKYNETAATGYVFSTKPLIEVKPTDKMAALLQLAGVSSAAPAALETQTAEGTAADAAAAPAPTLASATKAGSKSTQPI